jgi:hypothetical protein
MCTNNFPRGQFFFGKKLVFKLHHDKTEDFLRKFKNKSSTCSRKPNKHFRPSSNWH